MHFEITYYKIITYFLCVFHFSYFLYTDMHVFDVVGIYVILCRFFFLMRNSMFRVFKEAMSGISVLKSGCPATWVSSLTVLTSHLQGCVVFVYINLDLFVLPETLILESIALGDILKPVPIEFYL